MNNTKYATGVQGHVLVLGGTGGIGYEVVMALVACGVTSVSFSYAGNAAKAADLSKKLQEMGIKSFASAINQSDEVSFAQFLEDAVTHIGEEVSVVVNAIGISPNIPLEVQTLEGVDGWRNVFEVNVFGCFISTRVIAERMKSKKVKGSIVLITSTNGINSQSSISAHYDSSKAAQIMMMKIMAEHYAPDVRINGVAPGWVNTKMNDTLPQDERQRELEKIWIKRFAEPSEIANFVAYLCGPGSSFIFGQNLMIDGGYR